MDISFTQFLRPHGKKKEVSFFIDPAYDERVKELLAAGFVFEVEQLTTGEVSLEVCMRCDRTADGEHDTLSMEICDNGPPVLVAVAKLVADAYTTWKARVPA